MNGILLFLFVLSVLVIVHEWGHYYAAKRLGIRVERFSIGFGPILFRCRPKETEFCFSLFPLGGYVKLAGENPEESKGEKWEFHTRPNLHKFIVVFCGPLLNAILAYVLFVAVFMIGQPVFTSQIGEVVKDHPAAKAGLQPMDRIVEVNGNKINLWEELLVELQGESADNLNLIVERDGKELPIRVEPAVVEVKDLLGRTQKVRRMGILPSGDAIHVKESFFDSLGMAFNKVFQLVKLILLSLWMVITGAMAFKDSLAGPIGIYMMTEQAAQVGISYFLDFMGRLSVSLFIINLLPIPVLDGGHLFFITLESIFKREIGDQVKEWSLRVGLVLILALTVFVIYQDMVKFEIFQKIGSFIGL